MQLAGERRPFRALEYTQYICEYVCLFVCIGVMGVILYRYLRADIHTHTHTHTYSNVYIILPTSYKHICRRRSAAVYGEDIIIYIYVCVCVCVSYTHYKTIALMILCIRKIMIFLLCYIISCAENFNIFILPSPLSNINKLFVLVRLEYRTQSPVRNNYL